jgi:hypothetical protein
MLIMLLQGRHDGMRGVLSAFGVRASAVLDPPGCVRACAAAGLNGGPKKRQGRPRLRKKLHRILIWRRSWITAWLPSVCKESLNTSQRRSVFVDGHTTGAI